MILSFCFLCSLSLPKNGLGTKTIPIRSGSLPFYEHVQYISESDSIRCPKKFRVVIMTNMYSTSRSMSEFLMTTSIWIGCGRQIWQPGHLLLGFFHLFHERIWRSCIWFISTRSCLLNLQGRISRRPNVPNLVAAVGLSSVVNVGALGLVVIYQENKGILGTTDHHPPIWIISVRWVHDISGQLLNRIIPIQKVSEACTSLNSSQLRH